MIRLSPSLVVRLALVAAVPACTPSPGRDRAADSSVARPAADRPSAAAAAPAAADTAAFHRERVVDFARDGHPFTIVVDARGPAADSLQVRLRIVRGDTVFHRADWTTRLYGTYDARPVSPDSSRRRARAQLDRILSDSAFRPVPAFLGGARDRDALLREAIAFDVAVDAERTRLGLTHADSLPLAAAQSPPPTTDSARVRALVAELRDVPAVRYHTGGEATYTIAWSPSERRFVTVVACC